MEDDSVLSDLINTQMSKIHAIDCAENLSKAHFFINTKTYDLLILDIFLPDGNVCGFCEHLKQNQIFLTTLFLTAESNICEKLIYMQSGSDYLIKPFNMVELELRIVALLEKHYQMKALKIKKDNLEIDSFSHQVYLNDLEIKLNRKEFLILELFLRNQQQIMSRVILAEQIWQDERVLVGNTIETTISSLRRKLGKNLIKTVKGVGYIIHSH